MTDHKMADSPAFGVGLATLTTEDEINTVLDVWFPSDQLFVGAAAAQRAELAGAPIGLASLPPQQSDALLSPEQAGLVQGASAIDSIRGVRTALVTVFIASLAQRPIDAGDAYLRLHLLSHRRIRPHGLSMDGIFGVLSNVAWTSSGPCPVERVEHARLQARARGNVLQVFSVDKFPRMTDYVVPTGVRIADADRVRLGAHLAPGTTVMHEGFVNYHAGTLGASMVEGRISAGVVVGDGSDIGGGASIMGTLSGGGSQVISIGERCLLGANAGLGISLGDECIVESGCYVTAGAKVRLTGGGRDGELVKAAKLSGASGILFRRSSITGALEALPTSGKWGGLNSSLHAND